MITEAAALVISSLIALAGTGAAAGANAAQANKAGAAADAWNAKIAEKEDQQNRFNNLLSMRSMNLNEQGFGENQKMNNALLYQNQFNKMLSTINSNVALKNMVRQRWGGK